MGCYGVDIGEQGRCRAVQLEGSDTKAFDVLQYSWHGTFKLSYIRCHHSLIAIEVLYRLLVWNTGRPQHLDCKTFLEAHPEITIRFYVLRNEEGNI